MLDDRKDLNDVMIFEVFSKDFMNSNFWIYWKTMFAFEPWHSAMEMRRYLMRFVHHIGGLADFSALKFTKYNQYESLVLPMIAYLESHGVQFEYDVQVLDIKVDVTTTEKVAREMKLKRQGKEETMLLTPNDLVFVTNGSITESSTYGDNESQHLLRKSQEVVGTYGVILLNKALSLVTQKSFIKIYLKSWFVSATATTNNKIIIDTIESICKRDPLPARR